MVQIVGYVISPTVTKLIIFPGNLMFFIAAYITCR